MEKIFIVEDDENIRELIIYALDNAGFKSQGFESSKGFYESLDKEAPALIILDIMLPLEDGFSILEKLKSNTSTRDIPVIFLTAKTSEINRVKGLDAGADDYILKPFSVIELISRVKAVLRRYKLRPEKQILYIKDLSLDPNTRLVKIQDEEIDLTYKEFQLLEYLLKNKNLVLTRDMIMNQVWGFDFQGESRTIDVHIGSLRQKLNTYGDLIHTVRNVGYKIEG